MRFIATIGVKYNREPHPHMPGMRGDDWFEVDAPSYEKARMIVERIFMNEWANLYEEKSFNYEAFPGKLFARIIYTESE